MKKRVLAALLTAAVAVETMGAPLTAMASEVTLPQSSVTEEADAGEASDVQDENTVKSGDSDSKVQQEASEIENLEGDSNIAETDEAEGPTLAEDTMLYASADTEHKKLTVSFPAFADVEGYTYEISDAEGKVLKTDALEVEKLDVKGDLEETFGEDGAYTATINLDETWPEELQIRVYDKEKTTYTACSLKLEEAVSSVAAAANAEENVDVVWTDTKDCDGYVVELLNANGQLVDSKTLEDEAACTFTTTETDLHVQVTPYMQEEDEAPVYYVSVQDEVSPLKTDAGDATTQETPSQETTTQEIATQEVATQAAEQPAVAAQIIPGGIASVRADAGDQQATITWTPAQNATAYRVYKSNPATGAMEILAVVTTTNCTVNNLRSGVTCWFAVEAIRDDNGTLTVGARSYTVAATPYITAPNAPTGFAGTNTNGATNLTWYANGIANGYVIYRYNYSKNKYVEIGRTTTTSFTDQGAGDTEKQKYMVVAFRTEDNRKFYYSAKGPEVLVYGSKTVSAAKSVHPIYYSAKITRKTGLYEKFRKDETKQGTIKPGKKVTIIYRRWKQSLVSYEGKKYYIYNGAMRVNGQSYTKNDYSTQAKELFINSKGYKSKSKYLIWISTYTQRVNVFQGSKGNWKLIRSEKCVTGKMSTYTPLGEFDVTKKKYAHYYGRNFYKHLTYFRGNNKMHTRPARRKGGKYLNATMGKPLSNGCVRLTDSLAKWVYKNVPKKATVLVY